MSNDRFDVAEVVTCSRDKANAYLEAGYRLLAVEQQAVWSDCPKRSKQTGGYVHKFLTFVLGRPHDVEAVDVGKASRD